MNLTEMKAATEAIIEAGELYGSHIEPAHDIVYLPWEDKHGKVADKLAAVGCHWDETYECWASF